jgi:hypothetical protein
VKSEPGIVKSSQDGLISAGIFYKMKVEEGKAYLSDPSLLAWQPRRPVSWSSDQTGNE